jgi:heme exporter protein A
VSPSAIAVRSVEKRFGGAAALAEIDLELDPGASLAILGPNGAGKSTLVRLMAGLGRPTAGNLEIEGAPATGRQARARVGLLADATFLYPQLSARENLIFAGRLYSLADPSARADALLADEGLCDVANRPAGEFSRGMAQRLAIARSLVHDPPILLLDEPFTGLDRRGAERLSQRLCRLHQEGRTLVLVTHDFTRAAEVADRAIVLSRGRIVSRIDTGELNADALERAYLEAAEGAE